MAKQSLALSLPVLLTRPEAQGQGFSRRLDERFGAKLQPMISPLMAPVFLAPPLPEGDFSGVIFTSSTGIALSMALTRPFPRRAYCVGAVTAQNARMAGFETTSADGDAETLFAAILADPPKGRLLHLRGQNARGNLAERLTAAGIPTLDLVVYRQDPRPLTAEALALLRAPGPVILPLFSPRSAAHFAKAMPADASARLFLAALGPVVADTATAIPYAALVTAKRPDADAMLDAIAELLVAASPP